MRFEGIKNKKKRKHRWKAWLRKSEIGLFSKQFYNKTVVENIYGTVPFIRALFDTDPSNTENEIGIPEVK